MKGVVFTEFFSFVEDAHSPEYLQEVIDASAVPSRGVYASTGTYHACEMAALVGALSHKTGADAATLLRVFGEHLFARFLDGFPTLFDDFDNAFDFLAAIESHIHSEVRKLYEDAELPSFDVAEHSPDRFRLIYTSSRHLGDFCEGLIRGCLSHFNEPASIRRRTIASTPNSVIEFTIEKAAQ
ncbi:MAG: heme NO-binding domain-containing protein [Pseudomonadota bacterium]